MQQFLATIAQYILNHPLSPEHHTIVLPTRRAAYHLKHIFASGYGHVPAYNGLLPRFTTLNAWLEHLSGLQQADRLLLKFECYAAYKEALGEAAQDLSAFFGWSDALLDDFNEIEAQGISPKVIFRELMEYSEIDNFSFLDEPLSDRQQRYRKFWSALKDIHQGYNRRLQEQGFGYAGLIARLVEEGWAERSEALHGTFVTVAGFNAFTRSEAAVLRQLEADGLGKVYFDTDSIWLDDPENHAGLFIRRNLRAKLGTAVQAPESVGNRGIWINHTVAPTKAAQVDAVAAILASLSANELEDTVLVLADEAMLIPVLNRLPPNVELANVTMGIPLSGSAFADWMDKLFELHEHLLRDERGPMLSSTALNALSAHPFSKLLESGGPALPPIDLRSQYSSLALTQEQMQKAGIDWMATVLADWSHHATTAADSLAQFAEKAREALDYEYGGTDAQGSLFTKHRPAMLALHMARMGLQALQRLLRKLAHFPQMAELDTTALRSIVADALATTRINLLGEPAKGLQIMGLLETRALGFGRVILCDANEDFLPGTGHTESFIPFEIKAYHKLPGKREKESVYAHHFYRLMHSCGQLHLVYHEDQTGPWAAEPTRYLQQLRYHLVPRYPGIQIAEQLIDTVDAVGHTGVDPLVKTPAIQKLIRDYLEKRLSASGINRFLESPLEWYYEFVLQLSPPTEPGNLDVANFGTLVHQCLERLFQSYEEGRILGTSEWKEMAARTDATLRSVFDESAEVHQYAQGLNRLHFETALLMVRSYLRREREEVEAGTEIEFVATEGRLSRQLTCQLEDGPATVLIKGFADLMLKRDNVLHIIDFKTGVVKVEDLKVKEFDIEAFAKKPKALQLLLYAWLLKSERNEAQLRPQIVSLPKPSDMGLMPDLNLDHEEDVAAFEEVLKQVVYRMHAALEDLYPNPDFKFARFEPLPG